MSFLEGYARRLGVLEYKGTWDASTGNPPAVAQRGGYYIVSVTGTTSLNGISTWSPGDWAIFNGTEWEKIDNTDLITSVAGKTGNVTLNITDIINLSTTLTNIQNSITQEVLDRIADVNAEETRATTAETTLQNNINAEATTRATEDLTFLKLNGSRSMTGSLNLGNNSISNVNNLTVSAKSETKTWVTTPAYTVATTNGTLNLNNTDATVHFITGSASNFSVIMPNATTLAKGTNFEIYNRTASAIVIKYLSGVVLGVLDAESVSSLILQDNTTSDGVYSPFTVEIAQASGILNYNLQAQAAFVTTSTTDTNITNFSITPASGEYFISFNSSNTSSLNNAECTCSLYKGAVQILGTERTARSTASNFILQLSTQGVASFNGIETLNVAVRLTTGTLTVNNRSVVMLRLGGA